MLPHFPEGHKNFYALFYVLLLEEEINIRQKKINIIQYKLIIKQPLSTNFKHSHSKIGVLISILILILDSTAFLKKNAFKHVIIGLYDTCQSII